MLATFFMSSRSYQDEKEKRWKSSGLSISCRPLPWHWCWLWGLRIWEPEFLRACCRVLTSPQLSQRFGFSGPRPWYKYNYLSKPQEMRSISKFTHLCKKNPIVWVNSGLNGPIQNQLHQLIFLGITCKAERSLASPFLTRLGMVVLKLRAILERSAEM